MVLKRISCYILSASAFSAAFSAGCGKEADTIEGDDRPEGVAVIQVENEIQVGLIDEPLSQALALVAAYREASLPEPHRAFADLYQPLLLARAGRYQDALDFIRQTEVAHGQSRRALIYAQIAVIALGEGHEERVLQFAELGDDALAAEDQGEAHWAIEAAAYLAAVHDSLGNTDRYDALVARYYTRRGLWFHNEIFRARLRAGDTEAATQQVLAHRGRGSATLSDALLGQAMQIERNLGPDAAADYYASCISAPTGSILLKNRTQAISWLVTHGRLDRIVEARPDFKAGSLDDLNWANAVHYVVRSLELDGEPGIQQAANLLSALDLAHTAPYIFARAGRSDEYRQAFLTFLENELPRGQPDHEALFDAAGLLHDAGFDDLAVMVMDAIPTGWRGQDYWLMMVELGELDRAIQLAEDEHQRIIQATEYIGPEKPARAELLLLRAYHARRLWLNGEQEEASDLFDQCMAGLNFSSEDGVYLPSSGRDAFRHIVQMRLRLGDVQRLLPVYLASDYATEHRQPEERAIRMMFARSLMHMGRFDDAAAILSQGVTVADLNVPPPPAPDPLELIEAGRLVESIGLIRPGHFRGHTIMPRSGIGAMRQSEVWQIVLQPSGERFIAEAAPRLAVEDLLDAMHRSQGYGLYSLVTKMDRAGRSEDATELVLTFAQGVDPDRIPPTNMAMVIELLRQRGMSGHAVDMALAYLKAIGPEHVRLELGGARLSDTPRFGGVESEEQAAESEQVPQANPIELGVRVRPPWLDWNPFFSLLAMAQCDTVRLDEDWGLTGDAATQAQHILDNVVRQRLDDLVWPGEMQPPISADRRSSLYALGNPYALGNGPKKPRFILGLVVVLPDLNQHLRGNE